MPEHRDSNNRKGGEREQRNRDETEPLQLPLGAGHAGGALHYALRQDAVVKQVVVQGDGKPKPAEG